MSRGWVIVGSASALTGAVLASYLMAPQAVRHGQIVFVVSTGDESREVDNSVDSIEIRDCEGTPDGLRVTGHVSASDELVSVLVTSGDPTDEGRAVAAGFARDASLLTAGEVGDFVVTLPWASRTSRFEVRGGDSPQGARDFRVGEVSRCPIGTG